MSHNQYKRPEYEYDHVTSEGVIYIYICHIKNTLTLIIMYLLWLG